MKRICKLFSLILCLCLCLPLVACGPKTSTTDKLKVFAPDGAPALALSGMLAEDGDKYDFTVVASSSIGSKLVDGSADLAIVPTNAAVNLYNKGKDYRIAALATVGNLYLIGKGDFTLSDLTGKTLGVFGQNNVPDLVLRALLSDNDMETVVSDEAVAGKVALKYFADGPAVMQAIKKDIVPFGLLPEPAATAALGNIDGAKLLDVQAERQKITGSYGFPQAVLVVKGSLLEDRKADVDAFLTRYATLGTWAEEHPQEAVAAVSAHMAEGVEASIKALTKETAKRCNIRVDRIDETARNQVKAFMQDIIDLGLSESIGGKLPADTIFYHA